MARQWHIKAAAAEASVDVIYPTDCGRAEKTVQPVNPAESKHRRVTLSNFPFYYFIFWIICESSLSQTTSVLQRTQESRSQQKTKQIQE